MNFPAFFIRRPAFTLVLMIFMVLVGWLAYVHLPVRWIPNVTPPVLSVSTLYAGASANLVETQITTPIESALSGIEGVESIQSQSSPGASEITLNFKLGRNMDAAVEEVRSSLANVVGTLPRDILPPVVSKSQLNDIPILFVAFQDAKRSRKEVTDYVDQFVIPHLQTVEGVASVVTYGRAASAMRIWLDPQKMAASGVTVEDIDLALTQQNVQVPSGMIRGVDRYYNVVTNESMTSTTQFNDLIIRQQPHQLIRLKNVGEAMIAPASTDSAFRVQGLPAVAIGVIPQTTANPLAVSRHVMTAFAALSKSLPVGMQSSVVFNVADFIQSSVNSVYEALLEAILFVLLVIFLFLGNWRATLIPILTIPVCLIATFPLLHLFHFSINTISLMAFVLAIGLVVDDAIVMLENISRYRESGMSPMAAALHGSQEMVFPIIAMTLTLAAVYAPIAFTSGILGTIFSEFALTLSGAVILSGVVALTLTPMMCSRLLQENVVTSGYSQWFVRHFQRVRLVYQNGLSQVLAKRFVVLILLCLIGVAGYALYRSLPSELAPAEDRDEIDVFVMAPSDASFAYTDGYVRQLEAIYAGIPEASSYLAAVGMGKPSMSFQMLNLKPWYKRFHSAQTIANQINAKATQFPGVTVMASVPPPPIAWFGGGNGGNSVEMAVMTSGEYKDLHRVMENLIDKLKQSPVFMQVDHQLKWDRSQFEVTIDREKAADLHVPMSNITNTISTLLAGRSSGKYEYGGKQYDILLQMNESLLSNPAILSQLYVRGEADNMVSLADFLSVKETTSPSALPHQERLRSDVLTASLAPGFTIADGVAVLNQVTKATLPDHVKASFMGEAKSYLEANAKMMMTFLLALAFIYLVLVAQFESFIDPLIILLTVPFAIIGALLLLKLAGGSLNLYSEIGMVTLIGLIAKHGILMTEFANRLREQGLSITAAIQEAAFLRFRPIVMTTAAMMLGAMPLALAIGAGAETRHQVGWVIVGGLLIGTFFSLIVVPVVYTYLAAWKKTSYRAAERKPQPVTE